MLDKQEYAKRRKKLMQQTGANSIIVLPSAKETLRNGDSAYPFRQNSDFYYLTGFNEPDAVLLLLPKRPEGEYILFNRPKNRSEEIWNGLRAGQKGAQTEFMADQSFSIHEFETMLLLLMQDRETIHYPIAANPPFEKILMRAFNTLRSKVRGGITTPTQFVDLAPSLHEMRILKSAAEQALIQKAVDISHLGHVRAMQMCKPGLFEHELEAELTYVFTREGATHAYTPIVGAGANSCILHYIQNNQKISDKAIVLIDAGAEYQNYAADITRSFPANGKFSAEQRALYELVLASQMAAIKTVKPGASWLAPQEAILKVLTQGLVDLKILKGQVDDLIAQRAYFPFYMHRSGHWLGLDVHDTGRYAINSKWRKLQANMVLTIEPGIYIPADIKGVHERWHHIGIRIEDNVSVTNTGYKVLSQAILKLPEDIEALMRQSSFTN